MSIDLTTASFDQEIRQYPGIAIVDFHAKWCGPCRILAPIVDQIEKQNPDIKIAKVNVDDEKQLQIDFKVRSIPTLIFFRNGQEVQRLIGLQKQDIIQTTISQI